MASCSQKSTASMNNAFKQIQLTGGTEEVVDRKGSQDEKQVEDPRAKSLQYTVKNTEKN